MKVHALFFSPHINTLICPKAFVLVHRLYEKSSVIRSHLLLVQDQTFVSLQVLKMFGSYFVLSTTSEDKANTHLILQDQFVPVGEGLKAKFSKTLHYVM